jgi:hypothetical protein
MPGWNVRWLLSAYGWTIICGVVACTAPLTSNNVSSLTPSGGLRPPARETLFTNTHALVLASGAVVVALLGVGTVELLMRLRRRRTERGMVATILAGSLMAFSVFGLVFGVLSLGLIGFFVLRSASGLRTDAEPHVPGPEPPLG